MMNVFKLVLTTLMLQSCFGNLFQSSFESSRSTASLKPVTDGFDSSKLESSIGLKSFQGIYYSMSSLTGVPTSNNAVQETYEKVRDGLPGGNKFSSFNESVQKSILLLSASFCDEFVKNDQAVEDLIGQGFSMSGDFTSSEAQAVSKGFVEAFYKDGVSAEIKSDAIETYKQMLNDLLGTDNGNLGKDDYVFSACAGTLASLPVAMN